MGAKTRKKKTVDRFTILVLGGDVTVQKIGGVTIRQNSKTGPVIAFGLVLEKKRLGALELSKTEPASATGGSVGLVLEGAKKFDLNPNQFLEALQTLLGTMNTKDFL